MDREAWQLPPAVIEALGHKEPFILSIDNTIDRKMVQERITSILTIKSTEPLLLMFNSGGGEIESGLLLISYLKMLKVPIVSLAVGKVGSMALVIYLSMPQKTRFAVPGSTFLAHAASGGPGVSGQINIEEEKLRGLDFKQASRLFKFQWDSLIDHDKTTRKIIADALGDTIKYGGKKISLHEFLLYDHWITAKIAEEIGIVSEIVMP
ncbi:ATP-dependent Clp protease proteolytic subunit [Patescibacteria group bacterium]|nr:ATP-dependent Clp protease proteolytic subunit [Patescibacteria group bacterium]